MIEPTSKAAMKELARAAGFEDWYEGWLHGTSYTDRTLSLQQSRFVERRTNFAALVAAKERERCAEACRQDAQKRIAEMPVRRYHADMIKHTTTACISAIGALKP